MRQHIIDGSTMKRICGDDTQYGYVSDEEYKTWEKCPVCFSEGRIVLPARRVKAHTNIPENEPQVKTALYLRSAL
jgi:hypothetical protein|tara:strand:+ start:925 stop:1149 length:225 start_codon:yes stop_codon:yes gene_type:complete